MEVEALRKSGEDLRQRLGVAEAQVRSLTSTLSASYGVRRWKVCAEPPPLLGTTKTTMCTRLQCLRVTVGVPISVLSPKQA